MTQQLFKAFENPLIKFLFALVLTLLYIIFLFNSYWGLGFLIINSVFLFLALFNPKMSQSKESLSYVALSFLFSLFVPLRSFWLSHYFTIFFVLFLDSLAVSRVGNNEYPLNFKTAIGAPVLSVIYIPAEIFTTIVNLINFIGNSKSSNLKSESLNPRSSTFLKGFIIAIPFLALFFLLFLSADPLFSKYVTDFASSIHINLNLNLWNIIQLLLVFGFFSSLLSFRKRDYKEFSLIDLVHKYKQEIAVAVLFISILFLAFLIVQAEYLFASSHYLKDLGVALSDYTRKGYMELLFISGISLSLVSVLIKRATDINKSSLIKNLSIVFLIEVFLLLLSATRRTYLYQDSFGFTEIRILGFILSLGMAGILISYLLKSLNLLNKISLFKIFLINIFLIVSLINIIDIDYLVGVVKPPTLGYGTDYYYIANLSSDGWQGWENTLNSLNTTQDCNSDLPRALYPLQDHLKTLKQRQEGNWHNLGAFTISDAQGLEMLENNSQLLEKVNKKFSFDNVKQSLSCK